jgi:hypothetical protein
MSNDILSKAFTTTRRLELEYRKISLFREPVLVFETSTRIVETETAPIAIESTVLENGFGR